MEDPLREEPFLCSRNLVGTVWGKKRSYFFFLRSRCSPGPLRGARGAARGVVLRSEKGQNARRFVFASGGTVNTQTMLG